MATDQAVVIKPIRILPAQLMITFWRSFCSFATKQSTKKFFIIIKSFLSCSISSKSCTYVYNVGLILCSCNNGRTERTWSNSKQLQQTYINNIFILKAVTLIFSITHFVFSEIPVMDNPSRNHMCLIVMTFRAMICSCVVTELWFHLTRTCSIMCTYIHAK